MSKKHLMKCPCGEGVLREEAIKIGNRYYHKECAERKKQKEKESEIDKKELKELKDYIYFDLYKKNVSMPFIMKQISEFRNEYGFRYKGMELALRYYYETLGNSLNENHGVGIIPYVYDEAKKHYEIILRVKKTMDSGVQLQNHKKVKINIKNKSRKKKIDYDISDL